jgi:hypothetical protein
MSWYKEFNSVFFISIGASSFAVLGLLIKYVFRSKCKRCKCCCLEIERDIEAEVHEHDVDVEKGTLDKEIQNEEVIKKEVKE